MTDLFDKAATAPRKMTLAQQALVNFLAEWQLHVIVEHRATVQALIAEILPAARQDVPASFGDVLQAADFVADCAARGLPPGHADWMDAHLRARRALIAFLSRRGTTAMRAHLDALSPATPAQKDAANA